VYRREDIVLKGTKVYHVEKRLKEVLGLIQRDDVYVRQMMSERFIITFPHPTDDIEYVLCTWENPNQAREFVDMGRCVKFALAMGAKSIHFKLLPDRQG